MSCTCLILALVACTSPAPAKLAPEATTAEVIAPVLQVMDPQAPVASFETMPLVPTLTTLAGKKVWVIDLDAVIMPTISKLLPEFAPGTNFEHIVPAGDPFMLLPKDQYPDAVIVGNGF
jgi:hypothetical protein